MIYLIIYDDLEKISLHEKSFFIVINYKYIKYMLY